MSFNLGSVCRGGGCRNLGSHPGPKGSSCRLPVYPSSPAPGISLIMWNALYTAEKVIIRWTLLTEACYFGVQFLGESCGGQQDREADGVGGAGRAAWPLALQLLPLGFQEGMEICLGGGAHAAVFTCMSARVCSHAGHIRVPS